MSSAKSEGRSWFFGLLRVVALVLLLAALAGGWLWWQYQSFLTTPLRVPEAGLEFKVERGAHVRRVAEQLAALGLVDEPRYFQLLIRLHPELQAIKSGSYQLEAGLTPLQLLRQLVEGKVMELPISFIEGWTFKQVRAALQSAPRLTQTLANLSDAEIMAKLGRPGLHPEGRFFPDTYRYPVDDSDEAVLKRAMTAMQQQLAKAWAGRAADLPYKSPDEALTMASIVEKETGVPEERPAIAGVFVRRLQKGMRLETDPTVIYGMGERYDGNIRKSDLQQPTPYNTYQIFGLPPTPIAMPGAAALQAALHPAAGEALFFVARGDGSHQFSATLSEHNAAVRRYQLKKQ